MKQPLACFLVTVFVLAFTGPIQAADWSFYGSVRMATFSVDVDQNVPGVDSDIDTQWALQPNSRIGANVTAGDVGGRFEYGSTPNLRHLYGTWNFGAGTLLIGQTETPLNEFYSNQVVNTDNNLQLEGMIFQGRRGQIRLTFGGFDVAFIEPNVHATASRGKTVTSSTSTNSSSGATYVSGSTTYGETGYNLPQIVLAYRYSSDLFSVKPFFGWQSYDAVTAVTSANQQESVSSVVYGLTGKVNIGPAFLAGSAFGGSNVGNMGVTTRTRSYGVIDPADGRIVDNTTMAIAGVIGFQLNDTFKFEGGYGVINSDVTVAGAKTEDSGFSYYLQSTITVAPGAFIVPEVGVLSNDEITTGGVKTKESETTYVGAKWQINF